MRNNYLKYLIQEKFKMSAFFFWKSSPKKWTKFSTFQLSTYSKGRRFSIAYYILKWVFEI